MKKAVPRTVTEDEEKMSALTMALWRVIQPHFREHIPEIRGRVNGMLEVRESFRIDDLMATTPSIPENEFRRYLHEAHQKGELRFDEIGGIDIISRTTDPSQ